MNAYFIIKRGQSSSKCAITHPETCTQKQCLHTPTESKFRSVPDVMDEISLPFGNPAP